MVTSSERDEDERMTRLGPLAGPVAATRVRMSDDHARMLAGDARMWPEPEVSAAWTGWLASLDRAAAHLAVIRPLVHDLLAEGVTDVVLSGMGGSSLFPEVLARTFAPAPGHPRLWVIDSTDPAAVLRVERAVPWASSIVIAASKSGGTVETLAHLARFTARLEAAHDADAARRIVVVTDPGSPLEERGRAERFRAVVHGDADVGGRYSALSPFGLLPAALLGIELDGLIDDARTAARGFATDPWAHAGPAQLAAVMAAAALAGRDVMHLLLPAEIRTLGGWIEQLVAESSGKHGVGVLPVLSDRVEEVRPDDRRFVIALGEQPGLDRVVEQGTPVLVVPWVGREQLATEVLRWMQAVPLLCASLGVDPFDQPDVAAAKSATARALADGKELERGRPLAAVLDGLDGSDAYIALLAYVDPDGIEAGAAEQLRAELATELDVPVTLGIGPRYLHSTGQLHKGGRGDGRFLVVVAEDAEDADVPSMPYGFSRLKRAQAAGDVRALRDAGRQVDVIDVAAVSLERQARARVRT
jgi:hypothetical protein